MIRIRKSTELYIIEDIRMYTWQDYEISKMHHIQNKLVLGLKKERVKIQLDKKSRQN